MVASLCEMRHLANTSHLSKEAYLRKTPKNGKSRAKVTRFASIPDWLCWPDSNEGNIMAPLGWDRLSRQTLVPLRLMDEVILAAAPESVTPGHSSLNHANKTSGFKYDW